jgi:hypothetical protein
MKRGSEMVGVTLPDWLISIVIIFYSAGFLGGIGIVAIVLRMLYRASRENERDQ